MRENRTGSAFLRPRLAAWLLLALVALNQPPWPNSSTTACPCPSPKSGAASRCGTRTDKPRHREQHGPGSAGLGPHYGYR